MKYDEAHLTIAVRRQLRELTAEIVRETLYEMRGASTLRSTLNSETSQCAASDVSRERSGDVPWIDVKDAAQLFGMTHASAKNSISRETFPVPTVKLGKRRVIDRHVLAAYFAAKESEGLTKFGMDKRQRVVSDLRQLRNGEVRNGKAQHW